MAAKIGLDTSLVIGMLDEQDVWHTPTRELMAALEAHDFEPVVFDCVLAEAIGTLARRTHEKRRTAQLPTLLAQLKPNSRRNLSCGCILICRISMMRSSPWSNKRTAN